MPDTFTSWDQNRNLIFEKFEHLKELILDIKNNVLDKLDEYITDHKKEVAEIRKEVDIMKSEIALLKVKSSMWGAIAGCFTAIMAILLQFLAAYFK